MDTTAHATGGFQQFQAEAFLNAVCPPSTVLAIDFAMPPKEGEERGARGTRAFQNAKDASGFISWVLNKGGEVWYSPAGYKMLEVTAEDGRPQAPRNKKNFAASRAFYLDLDVAHPGKKNAEKAYPDLTAALQAVLGFVNAHKLPKPSGLVCSGNGLHTYWLVDHPLPLEQWEPMARALAALGNAAGLKADLGCTVNPVCVLRLPGTPNRKDPTTPKDVTILGGQLGKTLPVSQLRDPLMAQVPAGFLAVKGTGGQPSMNDDLAIVYESKPATMAGILQGCEVFKHVAATRGADAGYDLWRKGVLTIAASCDDGDQHHHALSDGYSSYSPQETDRQFYNARGWLASGGKPTECKTFEHVLGCSSFCQRCPHKGKIPTPRALGEPQPVATAVATPSSGDDLPMGYIRRYGGIFYVKRGKDDEDDSFVQVLGHDVTNVSAFWNEDIQQFTFTGSAQLPSGPRQVFFASSELDAMKTDTYAKMFTRNRMLPTDPLAAGKFMRAWLQKLEAAKQTSQTKQQAFGWSTTDDGTLSGFATGGTFFNVDGTVQGNYCRYPSLAADYRPIGQAAEWMRVANLFLANTLPELQVLVAAGFGAPLVRFTGYSGLMLSAYSRDSGVGKSAAIKIAQAIWGNPKAIHHIDDTENAIAAKLATLNSLPSFWDELKVSAEAQNLVRLIFRLAQGRERARLDASATMRTQSSWETLVVAGTNHLLSDVIQAQVGNTDAGVRRLLEWEVKKADIDLLQKRTGAPSIADMTAEVAKLDLNRGVIGQLYGQWLASNAAHLPQLVQNAMQTVEKQMGITRSERFWAAAITVIAMGAHIANQQGWAKFDLPKIEAALRATLNRMRTISAVADQERVDISTAVSCKDLVHRYVRDQEAQLLVTDHMSTQGRLPQRPFVFREPAPGKVALVQIATKTGLLRFTRKEFVSWLHKQQLPAANTLDAIARELGGQQLKRTLGSGVDKYRTLQMDVIDIPLGNVDISDYAADIEPIQ